MPRKKQTKETTIPLIETEPAAPVPATPEGEAVLESPALQPLKLLGELAMRYQVAYQPERPAEMPTINCPQPTFTTCLGPEMSGLAQEQLQGAAAQHPQPGAGPAHCLPGECKQLGRQTRRGAARRRHRDRRPSIIVSPQPPQPRTLRPARRTCPSPAT